MKLILHICIINLIVYDRTTNKQLASKEIKNTPRPDVAKVYPNLYNASNSGFSADFDIDSSAWVNDVITIVSRYSTFAGGNGDDGTANHKADWWSQGFYANKNNFANLDQASLKDTTLTVTGWHANNNTQSQTNHYIIVWDKTQNKQLDVVKLNDSNKVHRPDVGRAYPGVYNSENSGFTVNLDATTNDWYNDQLQIVSRYSKFNSSNGDIGQGGYTDYWFAPIKLQADTNLVNQAYFDNISLSDGALHVVGWHLTNMNDVLNHQLILLRDNNNGQIVASADVSEGQSGYVLRNDLAEPKNYGSLKDAAKSGFSVLLANELV